MILANEVALVTGAGHGIGAAIAKQLAQQGARVAITYRHDKKGANDLVNLCQKDGYEVRAYHVEDLSDDSQCQQAFAKVIKDFGQLDIVVANASGAGLSVGKEDLNNLNMDDWVANLHENLVVAVTTTKYAIKALNTNKEGGKIVLIGSVLGLDGAGSPRISAYSAGKAATHNFGRTIAKVLAPKILVNVVAPGRCWSSAYDNSTKEEIAEKFAPNKHKRPIDWQEVAHAVQMVLENDSFIGQVIGVEAGFSLLSF